MNFIKKFFTKVKDEQGNNEIRELIRKHSVSDPGFANELRAILARHETDAELNNTTVSA